MPKKKSDLFRFWEELKRRKVIKATLVYLAVAYGILQAADIISPALGLPEWTITFVLVLLIIVFILVLVLTWVYDITPEGIKITQSVEQETEEKKIKTTPEIQITGEAETAGSAENSDMQMRIKALENELQQVRERSIPVKDIWKIAFKKLLVPVLIIAVVLLVVFNRQKLIKAMGIGDARRKIAMSHNSAAVVYINNEDYDAAKRELEEAIKSDPDYSYAWSNLLLSGEKKSLFFREGYENEGGVAGDFYEAIYRITEGACSDFHMAGRRTHPDGN